MDIDYGSWWHWYVDNCGMGNNFVSPTDDIKVVILERDHVAFGHNPRTGRIDNPFVTRNMQSFKVNQDDFLVNSGVFPNGLFLVMDNTALLPPQQQVSIAARSVLQKKKLFFVFPKVYGANFITADHFSFVVDNNDERTPLHLHLTEYVPFPDDLLRPSMIPAPRGNFSRTNNYLPMMFQLYPTPDEMVRRGIIRRRCAETFREELYRILSRPCIVPGGGNRRTSPTQSRFNREHDNIRAMQNTWQRLTPVVSMTIISMLNHPTSCSVSVFIHEDRAYQEGRLGHALCLVCPRDIASNTNALLGFVAAAVDNTYDMEDFLP